MTEKTVDIASRELRSCYQEHGPVAGTHHFTDYWGRDGFFALQGSLAIGDTEIAKQMVDLFLNHQRSDGLIPYRVMNGPITIMKYFGHPKRYSEPKPSYELRERGPLVLDGTTLSIMTLAQLWKTGQIEVEHYASKVEKALDFLKTREKFGLLWDGVMCEWNDAALKQGNLLYSNIIYWNMYRELGDDTKQAEIAQNLRERLWNGSFFADWHDDKRWDYFNPFGNLLAVAWGLATPEETESILQTAEDAKIQFTLESNTPKYPSKLVWWFSRLIGIGDYQNQGMLWWQPVCAYVVALAKSGRLKEAREQFSLMSKKIQADNKIWECYERDGRPAIRTLYRAEQPFAWAAGLILWANSYLK